MAGGTVSRHFRSTHSSLPYSFHSHPSSITSMLTVTKWKPPAPTNFQVTSLDPTTIKMDWCGSPLAAAYQFWSRNINTAGSILTSDNTTVSATTQDWYFLYPGVWNYEFCVSAVNGDLESGLSNFVVSFYKHLSLLTYSQISDADDHFHLR